MEELHIAWFTERGWGTGPVGRGRCRCSGFAFAQVATGNLDIAVIGQLPPPNLPLGNEFEPGPM